MPQVTVAAVQFATSTDVTENLATCLRMIDAAAATGAQLIVLPEFCNHLSVYDSAEHCHSVALDLDGPFVDSCARRARRHQAYVVLTVTVRRPDGVTITNLLLDPRGRVAAEADKQTLMGNERDYLRSGPRVAPVIETAFGRIGMYSCMDGVTCEVPRALAVGGALLLTNSLNSFALDEAALHVPVRAVENQVFVVAANKVGPLVPAHLLEAFVAALDIPAAALDGAGESQIVAPDGSVPAKAPRSGEHVVSATVDLTEVDRARAAHQLPARRPQLYAALAGSRTLTPPSNSAETLLAGAAAAPSGVAKLLEAGASLLVLPEFCEPPATIPHGVTVVGTRRDGSRHLGVVADASGVLLEQPQLHHTARLPWAAGDGDGPATLDLPWGRLAVAIGDDIALPEVARLAALAGVNVLAVCHRPTRPADMELLLAERAAENRLCIVAASPAGPTAGCALISPPAYSLFATDRAQPFDGTINVPDLLRIGPGQDHLVGPIHPRRAAQREVSLRTDLVAGRARAAAARLAGS
ncbi:MAG: carbon-nitrogen hydrolase family protein [bacterium]|nr:carbon-nitrogen hydrolase family protein [bacterium]